MERGYPHIVALLVAAGATPTTVGLVEQLVGRCLAGDVVTNAEAESVRAHSPDLIRVATKLRKPIAVLRRLAQYGFDINAKNGTTALHAAAMLGDLDVVQVLIELGSDPTISDDSFHATAAGWAQHFGHEPIRRYLEGLG